MKMDPKEAVEIINLYVKLGYWEHKNGQVVPTDYVKREYERHNKFAAYQRHSQELREEFDRNEWWPRFSKEKLEATIKEKQYEMAVRGKEDKTNEDALWRFRHLKWDVENIQYVL